MTWFQRARFGMFVHWGHHEGLELSWPMVGGIGAMGAGTIPAGEYQSTAMDFNPRPGAPAEWARLASASGMRYGILTAKHHDGFCLFDTRLGDFSAAHARYGGDVVGEYVEAFRSAGLRAGLYYSLSDWHHPDYPAWRDEDRPYRFGVTPAVDPARWPRYRDYLFGQVRELLTNYGPIDVLWFDGGWERSPDLWDAAGLRGLVRQLQPECLVNDRLPTQGDFETPEQFVPPQAPARTWECCMTMNESWAYNPADTRYKSSRALLDTLREVAGRGGNLLLNVGPRGDGTLPPEQVERLEAIGAWMAKHSESVLDTQAGLEAWQFYGPTTRRGDTVYLHLLMRPWETVTVRGIRVKRVKRAWRIDTGEELRFRWRAPVMETLFGSDPVGEVTVSVPEGVEVVALEL